MTTNELQQQDGHAQHAQQIAELPKDLAIVKMENDHIAALASARPRDHKSIIREIREQLAAYPSFALEAIYCKPVGKDPNSGQMKYARGLSVRAAEAVAEAYGFCRVHSDVVPIDDDTVKVTATFVDFQRGRIWTDSGLVSKFYKKRGGGTARHPEDRFNDVIVKAALSKRVREVILRSVPPGLRSELMEEARRTATKVLDSDTAAQMVGAFGTLGVTLEQLETFTGRKQQNWTQDDRIQLRGIYTAIDDGETTVAQAFPPPEQDNGRAEATAPVAAPSQPVQGDTASELMNPQQVETGEQKPADAPQRPRPDLENGGTTPASEPEPPPFDAPAEQPPAPAGDPLAIAAGVMGIEGRGGMSQGELYHAVTDKLGRTRTTGCEKLAKALGLQVDVSNLPAAKDAIKAALRGEQPPEAAPETDGGLPGDGPEPGPEDAPQPSEPVEEADSVGYVINAVNGAESLEELADAERRANALHSSGAIGGDELGDIVGSIDGKRQRLQEAAQPAPEQDDGSTLTDDVTELQEGVHAELDALLAAADGNSPKLQDDVQQRINAMKAEPDANLLLAATATWLVKVAQTGALQPMAYKILWQSCQLGK